ncbi:MAG: GDP-mannose 4,6-dehydratase [Chlamydiota bacterium]
MNPIFVTGASGFVGSHLSSLCPVIPMQGDLADFDNLKSQIEKHKPQSIIHLAAQSHVGSSYQNPKSTYEVNFLGTYNLVEALKASGFKGRLLYISSADVYGHAEYLPIDEVHPCNPLSPYAISKKAAELICLQEKAFDIIIARPFNHIGPGQNKLFALPSFAAQLKSIQKGEREPCLRIGNLQTTRDFCDVRDIVKGYLHLLEKGRAGEIYNLCKGEESGMAQMLEGLISLSGLKVQVEQDPFLVRPGEQPRVLGSFAKIYKDTGWKPEISLAQSLQDIWEHA